MFKNYLKIALRNFAKNKSYTIINIGGLVMGIAMFLLITIYTQHELTYNQFHKKADRIYQIEISGSFNTFVQIASLLKDNLTGYEMITRIDYHRCGGENPLITINDGQINKKLRVKDIRFVEQEFFEMFDFHVIHGDPNTALKEPYAIVLTKSTALQLFGIENPVGRTLHYYTNHRIQCDLKVTAIVEDAPSNSTISFNALGSLVTLYAERPNERNDWLNLGYATFVLLKNQNMKDFEENANALWLKKQKEIWPDRRYGKLCLVPFIDVQFYNNNKRQFIYIIQLVGILILSIAIINFVNLTIAKSISRLKEIGIRKVLGSHRFELIKQFLFEAIITCALAMPFVFMIIELSKQQLFQIINKRIPVDFLHQSFLIILLVAGIPIIAIIAGIYPALTLSAVNPTAILKGKITRVTKTISLKQILIVFQFAITISLLVCMIFVTKQVTFLKTNDLGYNHNNIIHFGQSRQIGRKYNVFKQKLLQNPNIISIARSNTPLGRPLNVGTSHKINDIPKPFKATTVDPDFIPTMGIDILEGRAFSWEIQSDKHNMSNKSGAIIVNETFVKEFELEPALGSEINSLWCNLKVIGVMKDFHYDSFHERIKPGALVYADWNSTINIKISNQNVSQTIHYIKEVWDEFSPELPFEYEFLDKTYDQLYQSEESLQKIVMLFSGIAIIIACLGLFGLVSYNTERRTKEIGVRKVIGASVKQIVVLLTKDITKWILIANIIAWPIAWYAMNKWLQNFAYRIDIGIYSFLLAGVLVLAVALLTVSYQTIKTATANPVEALRYE